jgi:pimeloyl-ACP methyl ester carboxylesterase
MNHTTQRVCIGQRVPPCTPLPDANLHSRAGRDTDTTVTSGDGHAFAVHRTGSGTPILLLHDMAATQRAWDPVREALSWSNAVCTWDARGHGAARGTPESAVPTLGLLAADLDAALAACAPDAAVLVGHGLGALTILEYLRNYDGGRVSGVVLVDQSPRMLTVPDWRLGLCGGFREADALEFEARIRADFAEAWLSLHAHGADAGSHARHGELPRRPLRELATGSMLALWRSMLSRDYRVDLATLPVPLLAVLGGGSNLYDAALLGRWFEASVPQAEIVRYPKADHAPHAASPARFARDVAAFAARCEPVARHSAARAADRAGGVPFVPAAQAAA